jgi:D-glycero-alpha-D-manno-heptose-7-phosphate kinase
VARTAEVFAPCRADLAGGTLDIWPLGLLHRGALTVNAALPVGVRVAVAEAGELAGRVAHEHGGETRVLTPEDGTRDLTAAVAFSLRPEGGLRVRVLEQPPLGSGLGGSSAYGVALATALGNLDGRPMVPERTVALVRDLEARLLRTPTGTQDHWAAVRGGVLAVHLEPGGERVESLEVDPAWLRGRLLVFFSGITHHSGMVNWRVMRRRLDGDPDATAGFEAIAAAARKCREALLAQDEAGVAAAIRRDWEARRRLAPEVAPPELEKLVRAALAGGALAVKACGAGGGGSLLAWCSPESLSRVAEALGAAAPAGRMLTPR